MGMGNAHIGPVVPAVVGLQNGKTVPDLALTPLVSLRCAAPTPGRNLSRQEFFRRTLILTSWLAATSTFTSWT